MLSEILTELEAALREYYGAINELKAGLKVKMPPKPKPLIEYERCQALGLPLTEGSVMNQPYIWLQQIAVIIDQEMLFKLLEEQQRSNMP